MEEVKEKNMEEVKETKRRTAKKASSKIPKIPGAKMVPIFVPTDGENTVLEGGINGNFFAIKRGEMVMVPEAIFKLVADSLADKKERYQEFMASNKSLGKQMDF